MAIRTWLDKLKHIMEQPVHRIDKDIRIGIWGTKGSGKTTYISRLCMELMRSEKWLFAFNPKQKEAEEYINRIIDGIEEGYFPPKTQSGIVNVYDLILTGQSTPFLGTNVVISFVDAPGEFYEKTSLGEQKVKNQEGERIDILKYLLGCHGIIFLLDPEHSKGLPAIFRRLMPEFQRSYQNNSNDQTKTQLQQYMAFCINKVDMEDFREAAENPQIWAKKLMGKVVYDSLGTLCRNNRYKFFGVSSIGGHEIEVKGKKKFQSALISQNEVNSDSSDYQQGNVSSQDELNHSNPYYTPIRSRKPQQDTASEESNTSTSNRSYGRLSSSSEAKSSSPLSQKRFDSEQEPINVISPLDWLIESIRRNPPNIPNLETYSNSNLEKS